MIAVVYVVLRLTDDGVAIGLATAAQFLPVLVLGAWSGAIMDRVDRHKFMVKTQIGFTVIAAAFSLFSFADALAMPVIYGLSTAFGVSRPWTTPCVGRSSSTSWTARTYRTPWR